MGIKTSRGVKMGRGVKTHRGVKDYQEVLYAELPLPSMSMQRPEEPEEVPRVTIIDLFGDD